MRPILFITHDGYHLPTARVRCYRFAEELARRGFTTEVISLVDHLGVKYYGADTRKLSDTKRVQINRTLYKQIRKFPDALLYMQKVDYHMLAPLLAHKLMNMPLILDYDDYEIHNPPFHLLSILPGAWSKRITRKIVQNMDACVVSSHYLKDTFDQWKPGTRLIPTGVDTEKFYPGVSGREGQNEKVVFSWVGVVWGEPILNSIEFLFRCFSRLRHADRAILRLQGGGALWPELERLAENFTGKVEIELKSWVKPDEMPTEMDLTDVGLLPLIQDTPFNQAKSPTKLFEYMALAKPAIASDIGEACHVIVDGENGFLVDTEDEWTDSINKILDDTVLRQEMGITAQATVEKSYALNVLGDDLAEVVSEFVT